MLLLNLVQSPQITILFVPFFFIYILSFLSDLQAVVTDLPKPLPHLTANSKLEQVGEILLKGQLLGPESLAVKGDDMYTGLMDGRIVKIDLTTLKISTFFQFNPTCIPFINKTYDEYPPELEPHCGRPLGMRFDPQGRLLVAESYSRLYRFNVETKEREEIITSLPVKSNGEERKITLINDVDIAADNGEIFFTETSDRYGRNKIILETLSGRKCGSFVSLREEQGSSKRIVEVFDGFSPCNGLTMSHDQSTVFFISSPRVYRFDRKTRKISIALDNLPGVLDNIRKRKNKPNRYLIGCASKRASPFSLPDLLAPYPFIRNFITMICPQRLLLKLIPRVGLLMEVDLTPGKERLVRTFQDRRSEDGIYYVSEAEEHGEYTYLGTWHENHLVRAKTKELFADDE